jgi:hypothetical protein
MMQTSILFMTGEFVKAVKWQKMHNNTLYPCFDIYESKVLDIFTSL